MFTLASTSDIPKMATTTRKRSPPVSEFVVSCPRCKTLETLWFVNGRLTQTRKFSQSEGHVYHDCGSSEPCHIYRML